MDSEELKRFRAQLRKTQSEMAQLLGTSLKAVHSYEQGWRKIPAHVERQVLFLLASRRDGQAESGPCWEIKKCPPEMREQCPAWEFQLGGLCWFVNGTICEGTVHQDWREKMEACRQCEVLRPLLKP